MATPTKLYSFCSLAMAFLFAYSTSVQFNDPDWYFWIPLYGSGCIVNLLNWVISSKTIGNIAKVNLGLGIYLWMKVVAEGYMNNNNYYYYGKTGFLSLDLSERVVREKMGSGLVIFSMILQLMVNSPSSKVTRIRSKEVFSRYVQYGMATLVAFGYGLPFLFFVVQKGQMKF